MRNLIGLAAALALLSIPGCSRVYGGPSVSVTLSAGYSSYWDEDLDWENVIIINDTQVGFWVMLPSGRWVMRCRSMWWDSGCDDWRFGPWWYDYSISYGCHCHDYYRSFCPFHAVRFHPYMHRHYHNWHNRHFSHNNGHYIRRIDRHPNYRSRNNAPVIRSYERQSSAQMVRPEPQRDNSPVIQRENRRMSGQVAEPQNRTERTTVITRERTITRTDGGDRIHRANDAGAGRQAEMTRSRTTTRENSFRPGRTVTRTDTRTREIRRR